MHDHTIHWSAVLVFFTAAALLTACQAQVPKTGNATILHFSDVQSATLGPNWTQPDGNLNLRTGRYVATEFHSIIVRGPGTDLGRGSDGSIIGPWLVAAPAPEDAFEKATPSEVIAAIRRTALVPNIRLVPGVYYIRVADGNVGMLDLRGLIRWKLVEPVTRVSVFSTVRETDTTFFSPEKPSNYLGLEESSFGMPTTDKSGLYHAHHSSDLEAGYGNSNSNSRATINMAVIPVKDDMFDVATPEDNLVALKNAPIKSGQILGQGKERTYFFHAQSSGIFGVLQMIPKSDKPGVVTIRSKVVYAP